jgi:hypothetical protein
MAMVGRLASSTIVGMLNAIKPGALNFLVVDGSAPGPAKFLYSLSCGSWEKALTTLKPARLSSSVRVHESEYLLYAQPDGRILRPNVIASKTDGKDERQRYQGERDNSCRT